MGIAQVPDDRLRKLAEMSESRKVVPAGVEFVDIAALAKGSSTGEGLGNRFLGSLREVDALVYVLRAFDDPSVGPTGGPPTRPTTSPRWSSSWCWPTSPPSQGRIHRQQKAAKGDKSLLAEIAALEQAQAPARRGHPALPGRRSPPTSGDLLKQSFLLTTKPVLTVVNIGEDQLDDAGKLAAPFGDDDALAVSVQLEAEAARLDPEERSELLEGLGLGEGVVPRVAQRRLPPARPADVPHHRPDESRAWTFRAGAKAPGVRRA